MEQYIKKSTLVAEIKKKEKYAQTLGDNAINSSMQQFYDGMKQGCVDILSFIETVETKEVDLEKELDTWRHNHFHGRRDIFANGEYLERVSQLDIAKYFFELGLKTKQTTI